MSFFSFFPDPSTLQKPQEHLIWRAQTMPSLLQIEELYSLIAPTIYSYLSIERYTLVINAKYDRKYLSNSQEEVTKLLEEAESASPQASEYLRTVLIKRGLYQSIPIKKDNSPQIPSFVQGIDFSKEWTLQIFTFCEELLYKTGRPSENYAKESQLLWLPLPQKTQDIWPSFLERLDVSLQQKLRQNTRENVAEEISLIEYEDENREHLFYCVDEIDEYLQKEDSFAIDPEMTKKEKEVIESFLQKFFHLWGFYEELIEDHTPYDSRLHEYMGRSEPTKEEEEKMRQLRVVRRGFRTRRDEELIRRPHILILEGLMES